ncbi:MAG: preprotein translocase subunit YajC [Micromonosporaceae bacterium]
MTVPLAATNGGSSALPLLFIILIIGAMYFLMIRPQQRRTRAMQSMQASLGPGDEVMTSSGIYGEVVEIDEAEGSILLEVAPDVVMKFARGAVSRTVTPAQHETAEPDDAADADEAEFTEPEPAAPRADDRAEGANSVIERRKD